MVVLSSRQAVPEVIVAALVPEVAVISRLVEVPTLKLVLLLDHARIMLRKHEIMLVTVLVPVVKLEKVVVEKVVAWISWVQITQW